MFENNVVIEGRSQGSVAFTTSAAQSAILQPGTYAVWCDVDCFIKTHPSNASGVTTSNGLKIFSNNPGYIPLRLTQPSKIGVIGASSGTLSYHQIAS